MKDLTQYINEAYSRQELRELSVIYDCPNEVYVQIPERLSESDTQIYLDDTLLKKLPAETKKYSLGINYNNIVDTYFEYEKMEMCNGTTQTADILWDEHYNTDYNGGNMIVVRISGLKYIIKFDKFILDNVEEDKIGDTLYNLFNGLIERKDNLPFDITLNKDNITWK